jgi:hypothetical protein
MLGPVSQGMQDTDRDGQLTFEEMKAAKMKAASASTFAMTAASASALTPPRVKLGSGAPKAGFVGLEVTLDHPHRVAKVAT